MMRTASALLLSLSLTAGCVVPDKHYEPTDSDANDEDPPWTGIASGTDTNLHAIWGLSATQVYVVGDGAYTAWYDGINWTQLSTPVFVPLRAITGTLDGLHIYAVGDNGTILKLNGAVWEPMTSNTSVDLFAVLAMSDTDVYAAGQNGTIMHLDGTGTWTMMNSGSIEDLHALWAHPDAGIPYAAGDEDTRMQWTGTDWFSSTAGGIGHRGGWAGSDTTGAFVGTGGSVATYTEGTLQQYMPWDVGTTNDMLAVWANQSSPEDIFAVGEGGVARRFNGTFWADINLPTGGTMRGIWGQRFSDPPFVLVVGDGGDVWQFTPPP